MVWNSWVPKFQWKRGELSREGVAVDPEVEENEEARIQEEEVTSEAEMEVLVGDVMADHTEVVVALTGVVEVATEVEIEVMMIDVVADQHMMIEVLEDLMVMMIDAEDMTGILMLLVVMAVATKDKEAMTAEEVMKTDVGQLVHTIKEQLHQMVSTVAEIWHLNRVMVDPTDTALLPATVATPVATAPPMEIAQPPIRTLQLIHTEGLRPVVAIRIEVIEDTVGDLLRVMETHTLLHLAELPLQEVATTRHILLYHSKEACTKHALSNTRFHMRPESFDGQLREKNQNSQT